ncbi:13024_t:CDS:2, partial [Acaulospora colombiana]
MERGPMTTRQETITLHRFAMDPLQFCASPFVNKLDALLTFSGVKNIKYQGGLPSQAPRGKFPFIILEGTAVPDSELAYGHCIDKGILQCLDEGAGLNAKELALSVSIRALVEN